MQPMHVMIRISIPLGVPPKNILTQTNNKKDTREILMEGVSTKYLKNTPQKCQNHQKHGKSEKL